MCFFPKHCVHAGGSHSSGHAGVRSGCSIWPLGFSCKFSHSSEMSGVNFDCAASHGSWPRDFFLILGAGIFPLNARVEWWLWTVRLHFDCAGSHKLCIPILGPGLFSCKFSHELVLVTCSRSWALAGVNSRVNWFL